MPPTVVLVVDDDPVILNLLTLNFELEGFEVRSATNGSDALEVARSESVDVIVSDVMMPQMSGLELVHQIQADPRLAAIPVVLLSAKAQAGDVRLGLEAGAVDYVTKPFEPFDLIERVRSTLGA
jgi:two-component system alkaline phosphatase synthesis response regulator PhoP